MDPVHVMLPEDDLHKAAMILLYGFIVGVATRLFVAWRQRRAA